MGGAAAPFCLSEKTKKTDRKIGFRSQLVKHVPKPGSPGLTLGRIFEEIVAHLVASRFLPIPASLFQNINLPTWDEVEVIFLFDALEYFLEYMLRGGCVNRPWWVVDRRWIRSWAWHGRRSPTVGGQTPLHFRATFRFKFHRILRCHPLPLQV